MFPVQIGADLPNYMSRAIREYYDGYFASYLFQKRFGNLPELVEPVFWLEKHPLGWQKRLQEFNRTINEFNQFLQVPRNAPTICRHDLDELKKRLKINELPKLRTILSSMKTNGNKENPDDYLVAGAFNTIKNQLGEGGDWNWVVTECQDPFQAMSSLLIEGYALALSYLHDGDATLKRSFVKVFEEILLTHEDKNPLLLKDVTPWLKQEKMGFTKRIQKQIDGLIT